MIWRFGIGALAMIWAGACGGNSTSGGLQTTGGAGGNGSSTGGEPTCVDGAESCACYPNGTCDAGLSCLSDVCVELPATGGVGAGGESATGGTPTGGVVESTGGERSCSAGEESCPCYGNGTCNSGLNCLSDVCVQLPGAGGVAGGGSGGEGGIPVGGTASGGIAEDAGAGGESAGDGPGTGGRITTGGATARTGGAPTTGGAATTGGAVTTGGAATTGGLGGDPGTGGVSTGGLSWGGAATGGENAGGSAGEPPGYWRYLDWHGCAWTAVDDTNSGTTISPQDFTNHVEGEPYCASGSVGAHPEYESVALLGFNLNEAMAGADCSYDPSDVNSVGPPGVTLGDAGIAVNILKRGTDTAFTFRIQLHGPNGWTNANDRWCATVTATQGKIFIPYSDFNTYCWDASGTDYAGEPVSSIVFYVPGQPTETPFSFCINGFATGNTAEDAPDTTANPNE